MATTVIRNADWAIAWQPNAGRHVYMREIDVAFDGSTITHVGKSYAGPADKVVDGRKRMVMAGLVNLHSHPEHEPAYRGESEEHRLPNMYMSGLFERSQASWHTPRASMRFAMKHTQATLPAARAHATSACARAATHGG